MSVDTLLLAYIAAFGALCAFLIGRDSRFGWAMCAQSCAYAIIFGWAALLPLLPVLDQPYLLVAMRVLLAVALTWATGELLYARATRARRDE